MAAFILLGLLTPGAGAKPMAPVNVRTQTAGHASWILPTEKEDRFRWLALLVVSSEEATGGDVVRDFVAIRGKCRSTQGGGFQCGGAGRVHAFGVDAFTVDDDLGHALLNVRARGKRYRAEWIAHEPAPGIYSSFEGCMDPEGNEEYGQGGGLWRHADATARFAGMKLEPATHEFASAYLARGAMVTQCEGSFPQAMDSEGNAILYRWSVPNRS